MNKNNVDILEGSEWVTATPDSNNITMPFYITEIGHFYAGENYMTDRSGYDSYMLIYSVKGSGYLISDGFNGEIPEGSAVLFDCRKPHCYNGRGERWEFYWVHIDGIGADGIEKAVNYNGIKAVNIRNRGELIMQIRRMIDIGENNDICTLSEISACMHTMFNIMLRDSLDMSGGAGGGHTDEIQCAVSYIEENYAEQISIDDITEQIHVSKYYFIRLFKQYIGMTPYSYLINYRINQSKILLRTSDMSVSEISVRTGFSDVSNFINHFKKQTGQKPMDYRRNFAN